jgi:hypothetical protein
MKCRSIADVLRSLGAVPPSDLFSAENTEPQPVEIASDPPAPWCRVEMIAAALARDVVERGESPRRWSLTRSGNTQRRCKAITRQICRVDLKASRPQTCAGVLCFMRG